MAKHTKKSADSISDQVRQIISDAFNGYLQGKSLDGTSAQDSVKIKNALDGMEQQDREAIAADIRKQIEKKGWATSWGVSRLVNADYETAGALLNDILVHTNF